MSILDKIGEIAIRTSEKIVYYLLGLLIGIINASRNISDRIYRSFEKRGIEYMDYLILQIQVVIAVLIIATVAYIFDWIRFKILVFIFIVFGTYYLYLVISKVKLYYKDHIAYREYFVSILGMLALLIVVKIIKPTVAFVPLPEIHILILSIILWISISLLFKSKYRRDYTFGKVIEAGNHIKVRVNYDLMANVTRGVHLFENKVNAKEGDRVKLRIQWRNLKASKIIGVEEVVK